MNRLLAILVVFGLVLSGCMGLKKECKDSACFEEAKENCEEAFFEIELMPQVTVKFEVGRGADVCQLTEKHYVRGRFAFGSACTRSFPATEDEDWECESIPVTED